MTLANIVLSGTLTTDPEKRFTPNNNVAVTNFALLVKSTGRGGVETGFQVKVTCWRQMAEVAAEQLRKGDAVVVEGRLLLNTFQTPEGLQKKTYEIEAASVDKAPGELQPLLIAAGGGESRGDQPQQPTYATAPRAAAPPSQEAPQPPAPPRQEDAFSNFSAEDLLTEDDIPF